MPDLRKAADKKPGRNKLKELEGDKAYWKAYDAYVQSILSEPLSRLYDLENKLAPHLKVARSFYTENEKRMKDKSYSKEDLDWLKKHRKFAYDLGVLLRDVEKALKSKKF
ncbi:hypothetical protein AB2B41_12790 [Marimonas sp. MJW-29]|uniref:Uncharacterized protein n=1 Tax=Sulfitobacter sediminis TaxID=3234186 RepID=A0ABV3RNE1_9RHOB